MERMKLLGAEGLTANFPAAQELRRRRKPPFAFHPAAATDMAGEAATAHRQRERGGPRGTLVPPH